MLDVATYNDTIFAIGSFSLYIAINENITYASSSIESYIVAFDKDKNLVWSNQVTFGPGDDIATSLIIDPNSRYLVIAGASSNAPSLKIKDVSYANLLSFGKFVWHARYSLDGEYLSSVAISTKFVDNCVAISAGPSSIAMLANIGSHGRSTNANYKTSTNTWQFEHLVTRYNQTCTKCYAGSYQTQLDAQSISACKNCDPGTASAFVRICFYSTYRLDWSFSCFHLCTL